MAKPGYAYQFVALMRQFSLKFHPVPEIPKGRCIFEVHPKDFHEAEKVINGDFVNETFEKLSEAMTAYAFLATAFQTVTLGTFLMARGPKALYNEVAGRAFPETPFHRAAFARSLLTLTEDNLALLRDYNQGRLGPRARGGPSSKDDGDGDGGSGGGIEDSSSLDGGFDIPEPSFLDFLFSRSLTDDVGTGAVVLARQKLYEGIPLANDMMKMIVVHGALHYDAIKAHDSGVLAALVGQIPPAVRYQPSLETDVGGLDELIATTAKKGSITCVHVPADALTDTNNLAASVIHMDGSAVAVLSQHQISEYGLYPAVGNSSAHGIQNVVAVSSKDAEAVSKVVHLKGSNTSALVAAAADLSGQDDDELGNPSYVYLVGGIKEAIAKAAKLAHDLQLKLVHLVLLRF